MIYIGIDNGISGALVALSDHPGPPIGMITMPILRARKGNEIDPEAVINWIDDVTGQCLANATVIIEEPVGSKSAKAAASMAGSFHALRATMVLNGIRWHRITPHEWQRAMLPGAKGDTKPRALAKARQLWPSESFLASDRCRVPHDGMIDAALISEYGRIKNL